jgi:hypothetical protein
MTSIHRIYVLVRQDISLAQQMVQACHASAEMARQYYERTANIAHLVLLSVENEDKLLQAAERLSSQGIEHVVFHEPDNNMGFSALASQPVSSESSRAFKKWPLWKHETSL